MKSQPKARLVPTTIKPALWHAEIIKGPSTITPTLVTVQIIIHDSASATMADVKHVIIYILLIFLQKSTSTLSKEDLDIAEANGKLEIVKQVKKVNDDGSYTIGYEADDGSFKIESRDVQGNIKGTYGYLDEHGEIKRVTYTTNNSSEIVSKPEVSVVQRIPKLNRTVPSTTRRPVYIPTVPTTASTPVVIQAIPKRRTTEVPTTTTDKYSDFIKAAVEASKAVTIKPLYENTSPRILLQRPLLRSENLKSEGQIIRPDTNIRPTEPPLYKRFKPTLLDKESKPVTEEDDGHKNNQLRRQLQQERTNFNPREHIVNMQQSHGGDAVDVYSASLTTGTPRPLFTTSRPKYLSTTEGPILTRPTVRYPYETTMEPIETTSTTQVSKEEALVAIPGVNGRTILVPLSQIQGVQYEEPKNQEYIPYYVKRYQPQPEKFRAIPVRVDERGFVREMPTTTAYPVKPVNDYINNEEEINSITPPVSTKDFQKLLEQLILRQSRLEQINYITTKYQQMFGQKSHPIRPQRKYYDDDRYSGLEQQGLYTHNYNSYVAPDSYAPSRRVARLLTPQQQKDNQGDYLPSDVREMLLLRMLQLAINPGLPLNVPDNFESASSARYRKTAVRNVEILGEEDEDEKSNNGSR